MPGQRAKGQKQVLTMFDSAFLIEIAKAMRRAGYSDRSKFIRDAVFEKLKKNGILVDYEMVMAPSRARPITQNHYGSGNNNLNEGGASDPLPPKVKKEDYGKKVKRKKP